MLKISSSTEYATRLMVALARSRGAAAVSAERLSESENVPADFVNQLLLRLKRAGLVESRRGAGGGYALALPPEKVTLAQVLTAVEGSVFEDVCGKYNEGDKDCHHQRGCGISPVWRRLGELVEGYAGGITLADLLDETGACGRVAALLDKAAEARKT